MTLLIEGKEISVVENPSESQLENELGDLISKGHSLSMVIDFSCLVVFFLFSLYEYFARVYVKQYLMA